LLEFADILRILEAKTAEACTLVVDAMAVEVNDVIRLACTTSAVELLTQRGQRGRVEHVDADEASQRFRRLDQWQRTGAVIDVAAGIVLRSRGDKQDANGSRDDRDVE